MDSESPLVAQYCNEVMGLADAHARTGEITKLALHAYLPLTKYAHFGEWLLSQFYKYDYDRDGAIQMNELQAAAAQYLTETGEWERWIPGACTRTAAPAVAAETLVVVDRQVAAAAGKKHRHAQLTHLFALFDLDDSGEISSWELLLLGKARRDLGQKGGEWTDELNAELLHKLDSDGDGVVSCQEFVLLFDRSLPEGEQAFDDTIEELSVAAKAAKAANDSVAAAKIAVRVSAAKAAEDEMEAQVAADDAAAKAVVARAAADEAAARAAAAKAAADEATAARAAADEAAAKAAAAKAAAAKEAAARAAADGASVIRTAAAKAAQTVATAARSAALGSALQQLSSPPLDPRPRADSTLLAAPRPRADSTLLAAPRPRADSTLLARRPRADSTLLDLQWIERASQGSHEQLTQQICVGGSLSVHAHQLSEVEQLRREVFDLQLQNSLMAQQLAGGADQYEADQLRLQLERVQDTLQILDAEMEMMDGSSRNQLLQHEIECERVSRGARAVVQVQRGLRLSRLWRGWCSLHAAWCSLHRAAASHPTPCSSRVAEEAYAQSESSQVNEPRTTRPDQGQQQAWCGSWRPIAELNHQRFRQQQIKISLLKARSRIRRT